MSSYKINGVIESVRRMGTSRNGNPYFMVTLTDGRKIRTQIDSSVSYEIENSDNHGIGLVFDVSTSGRIWGLAKVENA